LSDGLAANALRLFLSQVAGNGQAGKPLILESERTFAPLPMRAAFVWGRALVQPSVSRPVDCAGLLVTFAEMSNRDGMAQSAGKPTLPSVGCPAVTWGRASVGTDCRLSALFGC